MNVSKTVPDGCSEVQSMPSLNLCRFSILGGLSKAVSFRY